MPNSALSAKIWETSIFTEVCVKSAKYTSRSRFFHWTLVSMLVARIFHRQKPLHLRLTFYLLVLFSWSFYSLRSSTLVKRLRVRILKRWLSLLLGEALFPRGRSSYLLDQSDHRKSPSLCSFCPLSYCLMRLSPNEATPNAIFPRPRARFFYLLSTSFFFSSLYLFGVFCETLLGSLVGCSTWPELFFCILLVNFIEISQTHWLIIHEILRTCKRPLPNSRYRWGTPALSALHIYVSLEFWARFSAFFHFFLSSSLQTRQMQYLWKWWYHFWHTKKKK